MKIVDLFVLVDFDIIVLNIFRGDLEYFKYIFYDRRIFIGESIIGGKGVNVNFLFGREVMKCDLLLVMRKIGFIVGYEDVDIFFFYFWFWWWDWCRGNFGFGRGF